MTYFYYLRLFRILICKRLNEKNRIKQVGYKGKTKNRSLARQIGRGRSGAVKGFILDRVFLPIFELNHFCIAVAICDLVHDMETRVYNSCMQCDHPNGILWHVFRNTSP